MPLLKNSDAVANAAANKINTSNDKFESIEETSGTAQTATVDTSVKQDAAKVDATKTQTADATKVETGPKVDDVKVGNTAPATQGTRAVATGNRAMGALEHLEGIMPVEYNTLMQIIATNGNFVDRETKKVLGDTLTFRPLSFQASWVVSPEDEKAPNDVVKFSMDGKFTNDGTPVETALQAMKDNGYPDARLKERTVVVVAIEAAAKTSDYNDQLAQMDLSPASRTQFNRFRFDLAYKMKIGKVQLDEDGTIRVKASAALKSRGSDTFTEAQFAIA